MIKPQKVSEYLERYEQMRGSYQLNINVAEDRLIEPFDLNEEGKVSEQVWNQLIEMAERYKVNADDVDEVKPLG